MSFHQFRGKCAQQGLCYDPSQLQYPGDKYFRCVTQRHKLKRKVLVIENDGSFSTRKPGRPRNDEQLLEKVSYEQYEAERKKSMRKGRICGDLTCLIYHESKMVRTKERICAYCGETCAMQCTACPDAPFLHYSSPRGKYKNYKCFFHYHNRAAYGLGKADTTRLLGKKRMDWEYPTDSQYRSNRKYVANLEADFQKATPEG